MSWVPETGSIGAVAAQFVRLADEDFRDYSPLYERLTREMATDGQLLARLLDLPDANRLPVNLFAAVHHLLRRDPQNELAAIYRGGPGDPWPLFRDFVDTHFGEIVAVLSRRAIQTNEVGRCTALVPSVGHVARLFPGRPIGLIEIGPSAGLNLFFDLYAVTYDDGRRFGDAAAPVQLACSVVGPAPPPLPDPSELVVQSREGIDLAPVDVRDRDACEWLEACIWPDVPGRLERFQAAVVSARTDPPRLHRGDALDLLGDVVDSVPEPCVPLVLTTWALAYLPKPGRLRVHELLAERGTRRDLALLTAEYPRVTPWVPEAPRPPTLEGKGATLISITSWQAGHEHSQPMAWMHAHGQWLDWFETSEVHA